MKKLVSSVLVLCMIAVALAGCGNKSTETTKATEATASTEAAVSTEAVSETQAAEGEAATVQVYIAASLSNAMDEISANYKSVQPNVDLVFNAGSSGKLQTQIEEGGACDVFFSAATKQMNALVEGGYVQEADVTDLLENKVQLIKPAGTETKVTGLRILQMRQTLHLQLIQFLLASMQERFLTTLVLQIR
ncbi:MAG: molybdate ABC transporter substrate-binding protein [Coprococcus sp.]